MHLRKVMTALLLLILCIIVLISASFAWLSLSRAPEITGVVTHVGSNGSLEIALLSDKTYMDPTQIRSGAGDSAVVQDATISNLTWGNVIDLSDDSYGLNQITMFPARLQLTPGEAGGHRINSNMLMIPDYGLDGRFSNFNYDTFTATYRDAQFTCSSKNQGYGVRGIGTVSQMMPQQAALAGARSLVRSYCSSAQAATISMWNSNGDGILDIVYRHYVEGNDVYTAEDVALLRDAAVRINSAWGYVDAAIRQAIVGYAATVESDAAQFKQIRTNVENVLIPLSAIIDAVPVSLPSSVTTAASLTESFRRQAQRAIECCDSVAKRDNLTWSDMVYAAQYTFYIHGMFLQGTKLDLLNSSFVPAKDMELTLTTGSGAVNTIANLIGNYSTVFTFREDTAITVKSASPLKTGYLQSMAEVLDKRQAAGSSADLEGVNLQNIYGYAVDMAFRCNADTTLLLQTAPDLRVEDAAAAQMVQGGGSYMRFTSDQLNTEQILHMMDALRVGFMDNRGNLLGVAKPGVGSHSEQNREVTAPLYFYEHTVALDGSISIGPRLPDNREIMMLTEDMPAILTVVVWLDGDHVDNSMAAIVSKSMTGTLNLQFASAADLNAADLIVNGE